MARFTLLTIALIVTVGCSTSVRREYLLGDEIGDAGSIERSLVRNAVVYKPRDARPNQDPTTIGNATQVSKAATAVTVQLTPITRPLVLARVKNELRERARKNKWSEARFENEVRAAAQPQTLRYVSGKQCFDGVMVMNGFRAKTKSEVPEPLQIRHWSGRVLQGSRVLNLVAIEGPRCENDNGRTYDTIPYRVRFGFTSFSECQVVVCTSAPINLTAAFTVEYKPRFEAGLLPISMTWGVPPKVSKSLTIARQ